MITINALAGIPNGESRGNARGLLAPESLNPAQGHGLGRNDRQPRRSNLLWELPWRAKVYRIAIAETQVHDCEVLSRSTSRGIDLKIIIWTGLALSLLCLGGCNNLKYQVGGTVTGLSGSGLVLEDNDGNNLGVTGNGTFTFGT